MLIILNISLVALASLTASFLLSAKLHRQLGHMIEGRIFQERSQNWPVNIHARYRASPRELALQVSSFALLGIAVGLLIYLEQQILLSLFTGASALVVFYLLTKEIRRNFRVEEERNRGIFENQRQKSP